MKLQVLGERFEIQLSWKLTLLLLQGVPPRCVVVQSPFGPLCFPHTFFERLRFSVSDYYGHSE